MDWIVGRSKNQNPFHFLPWQLGQLTFMGQNAYLVRRRVSELYELSLSFDFSAGVSRTKNAGDTQTVRNE